MSSEASGKMTQSRSSRGNISFVQAAVDGSFIEIENNTSGSKSKSQGLRGWNLKRAIPGKADVNFSFGDVTLAAGQKYRVYSRGAAPGPNEKVGCEFSVNSDCFTWGAGSGTTILSDEQRTEKASLKSTISGLK